ncbi:MAG: LuxR family transcriptional regulator [Sphingobium sp.]|nr:LuxR family transcriptional regulator [Sphingobium sp.]
MDTGIVPELDIIGSAATRAALWRHLRRYYQGKGFRGLAYFLVNRTGKETVRGFTVINRGFPPQVKQKYIDEEWGQKDPGPAYSLLRGQAARWRDVWAKIEPDTEQQRFLEVMSEAGLGDGYNFPVFGPRGRHGMLAVGYAVNEQVLEDAPVDEMHLIAQAAHMRLCQLLPDKIAIERPLSERELEILEWVARGKSNSVIADILHLSGGTVDTYLRRIYNKLDVSDRTSAAVRGVGMGLIAA